MALFDLLPFIGIPILIMTGAVTIDSHNRNKYATPWFLLVSIIGMFGVVFYYITIRTEERAESPSPPSTLTRIALPILSLVGALCAFAGIIGIIGALRGDGFIVAFLYGFPAIAVGILLYHDYSHGEFERQKLFVECLYALSLGGVLALGLFPREFASQFISYHMGTAIILLITVLFPLGWYAFRKNSDNRQSVQGV
ncbi:hypothetical protein [Halomicrobium sp. LC1Hm]|uniref:hypothetical protein n=1 Tax=Halomicrobium sp. LC1Hm TaxID=2610902 RepID=UPI0012983DCA|nr:hypothetical protein [Halomicrobium sp. LC1Hm]